jgi:hypothetical protein
METVEDFFISGFMTEAMCYIGQQMVYEEGAETIGRLTGIKVNGKQIERVCHHYGQKIEDEEDSRLEDRKEQYAEDKFYYIMADGAMLFTREDGWKEMKLCRIFDHKSVRKVSKKRNRITHSQYIGHLGSHEGFWAKVEPHISLIRNKIILADGAKWIWKWAEDKCPGATQILDYYHAKEHLCQFAEEQFKVPLHKRRWIDKQCLRLLNDEIDAVIADLETMKPSCGGACKAKNNLIQYYTTNSKRMMYKTYRKKGWAIGSGPIEAANRHVIQQRMKLSGQRWTTRGAQQLINLRMAHKSNHWHIVHNAINYKIAA